MLISLSPTIFDAGQLFRGRGQYAKSTVQDQKRFISKCAPLSKLIHNHTAPDRVARLSRWYKGKLLPEKDTKSWNSYLLKVSSLIGYGFGLFQTLEALSEKANELHTAFNALAPAEQEYEQPRIQHALQAIYAEQQTIYALLDRAPEENQEDSPVLKEMQKMGINLVSTGLMQHMQAVDQKLSHIEQEEEPHITSLVKYVVSVPRTETVIGSIAALVGALGVILQIPTIVCVLSAFLAISMIIIRCVKSIISDKQHAKKHDMLILRQVMSQYMETVQNAIRAIFQIKQDTSDIKQEAKDIKKTLQGFQEQLNDVRPVNNYYNIVIGDGIFPLEQQQRFLQGQVDALPELTSGSSSPDSSSSSSFEEDQILTVYKASSSKGKGRAEPTILEEYNIDDLLSSDSESDSDGVLTPEQAAKAQKRAAKNARIKALAERNAQLELENAAMKQKQAAIQALIA